MTRRPFILGMLSAAAYGQRFQRISMGRDVAVLSVRLLAGGSRILTSSTDDVVRIWDLKSGRILRSYRGPRFQSSFLMRDEKILTPGTEGTLRLWNLEDGSDVHVFEGGEGVLSAIAVLPNEIVAATGFAPAIYYWDFASARLKGKQPVSNGRILSMAFDSNRKLHSISEDATLCARAVLDQKPECKSLANTRLLQGFFSARAERVAAVSSGGIRVWDAMSYRDLSEKLAALPQPQRVVMTPDGKRLFSVDRSGRALFVDVDSGQQLKEVVIKGDATSLWVSIRQEASWAFVGTADGAVEVFQLS